MLPLIAVVGPTGAGKSDLALRIAQERGGEVVNFDSVQMYRGFDIGSAKVPVEERRGIPHHLIDVADPADEMTAGEFARLARAVLEDIRQRGKLPVLVGGTGFYLRALLMGLSPAPERDEGLRERLSGLRNAGALHRFLRRFDPAAAARIHPNDRQKLIRAVEMSMLAQRPASAVQAENRTGLSGYRTLLIGLTPAREALRERLNRRSEWMFAHGLVEETRGLMAAGVPSGAKPMLSLGYKQAAAVIEERMSVAEAVVECQARTRQYAKRQLTWFRAEAGVQWVNGFGAEAAVQDAALELVAESLGEA